VKDAKPRDAQLLSYTLIPTLGRLDRGKLTRTLDSRDFSFGCLSPA